MTEELRELRVSNDAMTDSEELRRRLAEEGYVFFKRLQSPDKLRQLRLEMATELQKGGWLVAGTDPLDGIADPAMACTEGDLGYTDVYHEAYKLESFHRIAHEPEILDMIERIAGRPAMPHPHKVARIWFPQFTEHTTPIHQDFVHFQGNFETYTAWAPVGDCPIELGALAVLPGSHKVNGVLDHHFSLGAGSLCLNPSEYVEEHPVLEVPWHTTNYEIGDTLIFPALTIHKALDNVTEDRMRISLDNRYQAIGDTISDHMLEPHLNGFHELTWDEIYENWESDEFKYYWKKLQNPTHARDMSYYEKGFDEALELARQGDERAYVHLRRQIAGAPESRDAQRARAALSELSVPLEAPPGPGSPGRN